MTAAWVPPATTDEHARWAKKAAVDRCMDVTGHSCQYSYQAKKAVAMRASWRYPAIAANGVGGRRRRRR